MLSSGESPRWGLLGAMACSASPEDTLVTAERALCRANPKMGLYGLSSVDSGAWANPLLTVNPSFFVP